ncbi:MAG: FHA domain-containing protein [Ktedonobacteraceae bacterium]
MCAIAVIALYTALRRRGTTRQLAAVIVVCVVCALLLMPALLWGSASFVAGQAALPAAEVTVSLVYVSLWALFVPLSVTVAYCLFTQPRISTASIQMPRQRTTRVNPARVVAPPRYQPGVEAPYVYSEDAPWGWLVYRGGRFQGQRLALKRAVITIGRGEDNDIWLDDDMASRHHAELAWADGQVYVTDANSLNGVLVNGKRIRGSATLDQGSMVEIGSHHFVFEVAAPPNAGQDDPLAHHARITPSAPGWSQENETPFPAMLIDRIASTLSGDDQWFTPPPMTTTGMAANYDVESEQTIKLNEGSSAPAPPPPSHPPGGPTPLRLPSKPKNP